MRIASIAPARRCSSPGSASAWSACAGSTSIPYTAEPRVGRLRHLYVLSGQRRLGVGRRLVSEVIEAARGRFDRLRLRTENPEAAQFYEAIGFRSSGATDNSTHVMVLGG